MMGAWEALPGAAARHRAASCASSTTARTTAAGISAPASRQATTRAPRPARCIRSSASIRKPDAGISISDGAAMPWLEGLPLDESNALLDRIWDVATADALTWRHQWRAGDLVLWDNRCVMHRRDAFDPGSRRVMHRTQIKG